MVGVWRQITVAGNVIGRDKPTTTITPLEQEQPASDSHSEQLGNRSSAALMLFAAEIAILHVFLEKRQCVQQRYLKNIGLLTHTEFLLQNTQVCDNALMHDPRQNQFHPPSAFEKICQLS